MRNFTPEQLKVRNAWLHDVFVGGGLITTPKRDISVQNYPWMYGQGRTGQTKIYLFPFFDIICYAIKFRKVGYIFFNNIDKAIEQLSQVWFSPDLATTAPYSNRTRKKPEILAAYIASFCAEHGIYWSNANSTLQEMDEIKKTLIGAALWDYQCFTSQEVTSHKVATQPKQPGQAPQNNYKQSGPQSANIRGLLGTAGIKLAASSSITFRIEGINANSLKVPATVHIKPLSKKGEASSGINKVFIGSANGYTDCACYFDDLKKAEDFLAKCQAVCPSNVTNLHIVKCHADKNGYFLVNTEFGECGIVASKLNEQLIEATKNSSPNIDPPTTIIGSLDLYEQGFYSEL